MPPAKICIVLHGMVVFKASKSQHSPTPRREKLFERLTIEHPVLYYQLACNSVICTPSEPVGDVLPELDASAAARLQGSIILYRAASLHFGCPLTFGACQ